jgi:hypothetical protein
MIRRIIVLVLIFLFISSPCVSAYGFGRILDEHDDRGNFLSNEENDYRNITDEINGGKFYRVCVEDDVFGNEAGKVIITLYFTKDSKPTNSFSLNYIIENGNREFVDGEFVFNEYDEGNLVATITYRIEFDLVNETSDISDPESYDILAKELKTTKNTEFDENGNPSFVEIERYDIEDDKDGFFDGKSISDFISMNHSNVEELFNQNGSGRVNTGAEITKYYYDEDGNIIASETLEYTIGGSVGNKTIIFTRGTLTNRMYDSSNNIYESRELLFNIGPIGSLPEDELPSFETIKNNTIRKYTGMTRTIYEDYNGSNAGKVTTENFQILRSVLESEDPESMLRLYDNATRTNSKINMRLLNQPAVGNEPEVGEIKYGEIILKDHFNHRGKARKQVVYNFVVDDNETRVFTDGKVVENIYDVYGRLKEEATVKFKLEFNENLGSEQGDYRNYDRTIVNFKLSKYKEYDHSGRNAVEEEEEYYKLENETDELDELLTEDGSIDLSDFVYTGGRDILMENFNPDGIPTTIRTENYIINDDGVKEYIDGTFNWNKMFDEENRIVESSTYELEFYINDILDENGSWVKPEPVNGEYSKENYDVRVDRLTIRKVGKDSSGKYLFDVYDNHLETETEEYDIREGGDGLADINSLSEYLEINLSMIKKNFEENESDFEWKSGTLENHLKYDFMGNSLVSESYNYYVEETTEGPIKEFKNGELINQQYDIRGNVIHSLTLNYKLKLKPGSVHPGSEADIEDINGSYNIFYKSITLTDYYDYDPDGNAHHVTENNYRILPDVLESDDPGSIIRLIDNETRTASIINTKMRTELEPEGIISNLSFFYGKETINRNYNSRNQPLEVLNLNYEYNEEGEKEFTGGELVGNTYESHRRNGSKIQIKFDLEHNLSRGSDTSNILDYNRDLIDIEVIQYSRDFWGNPLYEETEIYEIPEGIDSDLRNAPEIFIENFTDPDGRVDEGRFRKSSGRIVYNEDFDFKSDPKRTESFDYIIDYENEIQFTNGTIVLREFDNESRVVKTVTYELVLIPDNSGNDIYVGNEGIKISEVMLTPEQEYSFDVYDDPIDIQTREYEIKPEDQSIPGIKTLEELRNKTIMEIILILQVKFADSDSDGVLDIYDACPHHNPNGFDANFDGCTDSLTKLPNVLRSLHDDELSNKIKNSLFSKANNALKMDNKNKMKTTINILNAIMNELVAQSGKKISNDTAEMLIEYVNNVIVLIKR